MAGETKRNYKGGVRGVSEGVCRMDDRHRLRKKKKPRRPKIYITQEKVGRNKASMGEKAMEQPTVKTKSPHRNGNLAFEGLLFKLASMRSLGDN